MPQDGHAPKRHPVLLTVKTITDLSPNYRRICFTSEQLAHYPECSNGAHIKLMLAKPEQQQPVLPDMTPTGPKWQSPEDKPILRTFSIRQLRSEQHEIDIDFALHGEIGPASRFALTAKPGDHVGISPPGGPHPMRKPAEYYYIAGDLTAQPAISAMIEEMPAASQGYVAIQVSDARDIQDIACPPNLALRWFIGKPDETAPLIDSFRQQALTTENSYFWFGGEESIVLGLRRWARNELDVNRQQIYAIPYWRYGKDEDSYHTQRHQHTDK
ncbi:siderophore-interacting protein [Photobacterium rosenbergii]|uniref:Siderophore-interacting protein n=1 Tax=Photobacterium rosenbergii TaxID=294936 RepID=A0ABU3ZMN4_9GAMM|nr:siderophore-interacting protein [Photobacterium rosenbergii]MDV5171361.1 siderophore-interacting protein [Photobacterium rosenbergii]